ncbi:DUF3526 domain-containing protein [Methylobacillus gramineus]|uniref:ABC transporter permease n=1 Tax=Methylobacillus gramineus TaxID=755169 RepID=UPI001CFF858B|nr:DUF3526 domain-containing protein [Methylobacillus gramineus]MCB5185208.1 DUF3526 domain-containing protein [Methylobacillus gramineus]
MSIVLRIAREEWRSLLRNRVAVMGTILLTILMLIASLTAWEHQRNAGEERARYQAQSNHEFESQPDRHPHRVAHYGHFLFRPLNALAAFDPGINAYTGNTLFLEAHRQNSANFGDVRQSSLLLRFGQLTPAFVLQVLAPLLLIFVGFAGVSRERESGTLRVLLTQGVSSQQLVIGKLVALLGFSGLILLPAVVGLCLLSVSGASAWAMTLLLIGGYTLWLLLWSLAVIFISSLCQRGRDSLLALMAIWVLVVILLPRWVPDMANAAIALPTRFENEISVQREYLALGDAHNPDDPKFAEFRDKVLKQYGVTRIEDLPVNFKGLVGMEGERKSSELFSHYSTRAFDLQAQQNSFVDGFSLLSPLFALKRLSMTASGTDLQNFRRFLEQGEQYRYNLVQGLNKLQAESLTYADDTNRQKENRIARSNWQAFPEFKFTPGSSIETLKGALASIGVLTLWIMVLGVLSWLQSRRLGRAIR